jgi:ParB/RepB/Spo0J family partition protein
MSNVETVAISSVKPNPVALRDVDKTTEAYQGLVDSIKQKGFLGAITVRPKSDADGDFLELVDGLHRFSAAQDAGLTEIHVAITDLDDSGVLEAQIMANIHKIETKPAQYAAQLKRILNNNPMLTSAELASKLGKSTQWLEQRLGITKIEEEKIVNLINEGKINLTNAYALSRLPSDEQTDWVDRAMTESPDVFVPAANGRKKEIQEAKRKGKDAAPAEWQPQAHMQKLKDIKEEYSSATVGPALIQAQGLSSAEEGFAAAIAWALHLDPESVATAKAKHDALMAEREEAKARKKKEKEDQKSAEAAEAQAGLI